MTSLAITRGTRTAVVVSLLAVGLALGTPTTQPAYAHKQTELVAVSGTGSCPSGVESCTETWTHVNYWTHYTSSVSPGCSVEIIETCGIHVTSTAATSSCQNSSNCGHGPHGSTPQPAGPGTWTQWNGHQDINHRWSGQRREAVEHEHECPAGLVPGAFGICLLACPDGTYVVSGAECSEEGSTPAIEPSDTGSSPEPFFEPGDREDEKSDPCADGGCLPPCLTDGIAGNCPWESNPVPEPKVCTSVWDEATRQALLSRLRWESIVPYPPGFTGHQHPEVPGGQIFLTAASTAGNPARHWISQQPQTTLDVWDAPVDGCLWTANAVGVKLRELLPYEASDLAKLRSPGNVAAADEARQAADLWDRLGPERQEWFQAAFPRNDPSIVWCSPADLPPWTMPASKVLLLSSEWEDSHGRCRWEISRRGFWRWWIQVRYSSEQGDQHTATLASDLSWFREPAGYLGEQASLW
ncbi:hypothetical protein [Candidatus Poriferisocius sp.]|uniref:hypothetical protein n=1 Tax=Candidatus Poriferisocius sp. TaxID=3101276 RepID=UPI003B022959